MTDFEANFTPEEAIAAAIDAAEEIVDPRPEKPRLLVERHSPDKTVAELRNILLRSGELYDRGMPVRLVPDQTQQGMVARVMTPDDLVFMAHRLCRPYAIDKNGEEKNVQFPRNHALMYLGWCEGWKLPPLNGIASAPFLKEDGTITSAEGYDRASGMWCENVPDLADRVPECPTRAEAEAALRLVRETFKTFCFADAETLDDPSGIAIVDSSKAPGRDESGFLVGLLTAVCRPSLHLAPGVLFRAAPMSGAGAGKGLLARCICNIAFGRDPHAVTSGATAEELEKRISAELMQGSPALFLDNLNNTAFKSDLLASAITERPARVRVLGKSLMVPLNASAFVILTGNGLFVSEDLARRFIAVDFDPRVEDPEARPFKTDIQAYVKEHRTELLTAVLTVWRWGRRTTELEPGIPLGSFPQWCSWCRDPLLALGCQDPAKRVGEAKEHDTRRQAVVDLFTSWWEKHGDAPLTISQLDEDILRLVDPQGRGRQWQASALQRHVGTRIAGLVLSRQAAIGKWGVATYQLKKADNSGGEVHRGHREDRNASTTFDHDHKSAAPMAPPPMPPMPSATSQKAETLRWRGRI